MDNSVTILVSSCDLYEDAWYPFFKLLKIQWPECEQYRIVLNTETKTYNPDFIKFSISLTLVLLILVGALQIAIDPLFQYHQPWFGLQPVVTNERYQVAGMAKQLTFDNCILGNSLCENFKSSSFDKYYNGKTIKLSISGSVVYDWKYVLNLLKNRNGATKNIFCNIDPFTLNKTDGKSNADIPQYLYDTNYINDCS